MSRVPLCLMLGVGVAAIAQDKGRAAIGRVVDELLAGPTALALLLGRRAGLPPGPAPARG